MDYNPPLSQPTMRWRHQYDAAADEIEAKNTLIIITEPSLTRTEFRDEVDLNVMMQRMGVTDGSIPPLAPDERYFGDFTDAVDFRESLDRVREAEARFNALPADLRAKFANDPVELMKYVTNPENTLEAIELGLLSDTRIKTDPKEPQGGIPAAQDTTK